MLDSLCLKSKYAHVAYSEVEPLVFPDSMCLGKGLYVELFLVGALNSLQR